MCMSVTPSSFRIRSFVRRSGRKTEAQVRARKDTWASVGLEVANGMLDLKRLFGRDAPCVVDIGFGTGQSLLALAESRPDLNIIGVETHQAGIGALLLGLQQRGLTNVRVYDADVVDVVAHCLPANSLSSVQIFFPDPWQKRRHHARRLIQPSFITSLLAKLTASGEIHLATDWGDYAIQMLDVLSAETQLKNVAGAGHYANRSDYRPMTTKFENRALREGRHIYDLCFQKIPL